MENKDKETISLKSILVRYLHHWKFFLIVFIISFIPAILYLILYPRTYEVRASIKIQEDDNSTMASLGLGEAAGLMKSFGIGSGGGSISIDDEMAILASNRMLRTVTNDLGLNIIYRNPYSFYNIYNEAPLKLSADSVTMAGLDDEYRFSVSVSPGKIKVKAKSIVEGLGETFTYTSLPANIKVGTTEFKLDFDNDGASMGSFKLNIKCLPASWMAETLGKDIAIEDVSTSSNVLEFSFLEHSKERGKDILNTLVENYNEDCENYKYIEESKTLEFVNARIDKILLDLSEVELAIQQYKTKNDMTLIESDVLMYSEIIKELQVSLIEVESQSRLMNMLDEYVKDPANKYNVIPSIITAAEGEKGGVVSKYNEAIVARDKFLKNSSEKNSMFKTMDNQVEKLRIGVFAMIDNAQRNYSKTLESLKSKEHQLMSKMRSIPEKEREYVVFRRNQEILQGLYVLLLQQREEALMSIGNPTERARLIEPAYIVKKPVGPRKVYAAAGMLVLTLVITIGYLFAKDLFISIKEEYKKS